MNNSQAHWFDILRNMVGGAFRLASALSKGISTACLIIAVFIEPKGQSNGNTTGTGNQPGNGV